MAKETSRQMPVASSGTGKLSIVEQTKAKIAELNEHREKATKALKEEEAELVEKLAENRANQKALGLKSPGRKPGSKNKARAGTTDSTVEIGTFSGTVDMSSASATLGTGTIQDGEHTGSSDPAAAE